MTALQRSSGDKETAQGAPSVIDWSRALMVGAVAGGVFWGLAAGAILISEASAAAVIAICVAAVIVAAAGTILYRRSASTRNRAVGIGLILAPFTGAAPVLVVGLPSLVVHAFSWNG